MHPSLLLLTAEKMKPYDLEMILELCLYIYIDVYVCVCVCLLDLSSPVWMWNGFFGGSPHSNRAHMQRKGCNPVKVCVAAGCLGLLYVMAVVQG